MRIARKNSVGNTDARARDDEVDAARSIDEIRGALRASWHSNSAMRSSRQSVATKPYSPIPVRMERAK
jgi:hypothetical protein